jgi:hypothetical protein
VNGSRYCDESHKRECAWTHGHQHGHHRTRRLVLAAGFARALLVSPPPCSQEGAGKAGRRLAPAVCCAKGRKNERTAAYRWAGHPAFPARWLYGLCRALLGERCTIAPVASRMAMLRPVGPAASSLGLTVALDGQDHPVLPYAAARMSPQGFPARARGRKNVGETSLQRRSSARGFGLTGLAALPAPLAPDAAASTASPARDT